MSEARRTSKIYAIGLVEDDKGKDGNGKNPNKSHFEFGETYHMALAMELDDDIQVFVHSDTRTKPLAKNTTDFLNLLGYTEGNGRILNSLPPQEHRAYLPETWKIFVDASKNFPRSKLEKARDKIWDTIEEEANREGNTWKIPKELIPLDNKEKVLIWSRFEDKDPGRNTSFGSLLQLKRLCEEHDSIPLFTGTFDSTWDLSNFDISLRGFYEKSFFKDNSIAKQIWFIDQLFNKKHNIKASIGMMSGVLDGPAFFARNNTIFFAKKRHAAPRMACLSSIISELNFLPLRGNSRIPFCCFSRGELAHLEEYIWDPKY